MKWIPYWKESNTKTWYFFIWLLRYQINLFFCCCCCNAESYVNSVLIITSVCLLSFVINRNLITWYFCTKYLFSFIVKQSLFLLKIRNSFLSVFRVGSFTLQCLLLLIKFTNFSEIPSLCYFYLFITLANEEKFGLVCFYCISTIVGYLMPNRVFTYISNIWSVNTFCWYTQLNSQTVLFQTIQFSISQQS